MSLAYNTIILSFKIKSQGISLKYPYADAQIHSNFLGKLLTVYCIGN